MNKVWSDNGWADYLYWQSQDRKTLKRINELIKPQPNAETLAAMLENTERFSKRYNNFREILYEIDEEIAAEETDVQD